MTDEQHAEALRGAQTIRAHNITRIEQAYKIAQLETDTIRFEMLWREYALVEDSTLAPDAIDRKRRLRAIVGVDEQAERIRELDRQNSEMFQRCLEMDRQRWTIDRLRKALELAPHDGDCDSVNFFAKFLPPKLCNCWKSAALSAAPPEAPAPWVPESWTCKTHAPGACDGTGPCCIPNVAESPDEAKS